MARAWRKNNENNRRRGALERLQAATFTPKGDRTQEEWEAKRQGQIKILNSRVR